MDRRTLAAAVPVAAVAVVAAIVSFGHIETLALSVHQPIADARLLPFAIDFLIVAGSVILLAGYALGWLCVVSGVAATLFANVESGIGYGPLAAAVAAWPAVAFTVASFVLERWLRRQARAVPAKPPVPVPRRLEQRRRAPTSGYAASTSGNGHDPDVSRFRPEIQAGTVPPIREIRKRVHVGQPRAVELQDRIRALISAG